MSEPNRLEGFAVTTFTAVAGTGKQRFLRGPIPMPWLEAAACLPGRALHVAIHLWLWSGIKKRKHDLRLNLSRLQPLGVSRDTGRRGLAALERAGLVAVVRKPGSAAIVAIIEPKTLNP